jgi:Carboxypeptidase regulatory-like domain/TonB dependent receptor/TonB-dependent Receptor Plug Domain
MRLRLAVVPLVLFLLGAVAPAFAQRTTGTLVGNVTDESGAALPGVTVTLKGETIVGAQTAVTNESGFYRFVALPTGAYDVSYSLGGFATLNRNALKVSVGATVDESVTMKVSALQEEVTVTGEAPVVDTQTNQISTTYDKDWVRNAPIPRNSFFDLINSAPGVASTSSDGWNRQTSFGSGTNENSYQLDGTDFTAPISGASWPYPNTDAIEEIEVLSLGATAEYGNVQGAVFNIVTRQGSNTLKGDGTFYFQSDGLSGRNTTEEQDGGVPYHRDEYREFTGQVSGPIVKDKLWFFASYQHQKDAFSAVGVPEEFPARAKQNRVFGKLNWQLSPQHKLQFAYHDDYYELPSTGDAVTAPSAVGLNSGHNPSPNVTYTAVISDKTYVEARYAGFYGDDHGDPLDGSARINPRFIDLDTGVVTGGVYSWYDGKSNKTGANVKLSHFADNFLGGSHDFKFGVQYASGGGDYTTGYNDYIYTYGGVPAYGYTQLPFKEVGHMRTVGTFLDDTFRVSKALTLNLGVRYDHSVADLPGGPALDREGNPTSSDIPGIDSLFTWNSVSPRLGFAWKITGDGKNVLKGHYGKYYRGVITGEFDDVSPTISARYLFSGTYDGRGVPEDQELVSDNTNLAVDPDYKNPTTDQFIVGFERELAKNVGVQLNFVHKRGKNYGGYTETAGEYESTVYRDDQGADATGRDIVVQRLLSDPSDRLFFLTNPDGLSTRYNGLSIGVFKRMANNWQLTSSLVLSKSTGRVGSSTGGNLSSQSTGANVGGGFGRNPNDFVNTDGRLIADRPVTFKTQLVYQFPAGFLLGLNFTHQSGRPWARTVRVPNLGIQTTILAEPIDGSRRLPDWNLLDVNLTKDIKLSGTAKFSVFGYVLNATNSDIYEDVLDRNGNSENFGVPSAFIYPRRVMLGARVSF